MITTNEKFENSIKFIVFLIDSLSRLLYTFHDIMNNTINDQITTRIENMVNTNVFTTSDFKDLGKLATVRKVLSRLEEKGMIVRVMNGVYYRPPSKRSNVDPDKVAHALAKRFHWTIAPCGEVALNKLGISKQSPIVYSYVSDGPYRKYNWDSATITFKHRANRLITNMSNDTLLVTESLKALSKDNVTNTVIAKYKKLFTKQQKKQILKESKDTSEWIYQIIQEICL